MSTPNKKKLAIDARPLARGSGGIQRYLRKILSHLITSEQFKIILYSDKELTGLTKDESLKTQQRIVDLGKLSGSLWYLYAPAWLKLDKPDIFWSPRHHLPFLINPNCFNVVTIHDFVWKQSPQTMPLVQRISESLLMPSAIKRSNKLICISNTTSSQLKRYYPESIEKSKTIFHGNENLTNSNLYNHTRKQDKTYILSVGTLEPRKNYAALILAFDKYIQSGGQLELIIVGKIGWKTKDIYSAMESIESKDRISILNETSDDELELLYQNAQGFVSTSIDEGYGLPPQEAINYGLPTLLSNIDVYKELYPNSTLWCEANNVDDIAQKLHQLAISQTNSTSPVEQPLDRNSRSWKTCALEHESIFLNNRTKPMP